MAKGKVDFMQNLKEIVTQKRIYFILIFTSFIFKNYFDYEIPKFDELVDLILFGLTIFGIARTEK